MIQGQEDPLSLASDDEQVADSASTKTQRDVRSSSPAKRRASAMEDSSMNGAGPASTNGTASTSSKTSSKQHTREASVDMLTTNGNSGAPSTAPSSVPEADEEMEDAQEELPSIDEQVNIIMKEMTVELEDDMVGYAVASGWINRILARSSNKNDHGPYDKNILEGEVGPIDNSSIFPDRVSEPLVDDSGEEFIPLKPGLSTNNDVEIFTEKAFQFAVKWYGLAPGQTPIKRYAHANNPDGVDKNIQFELYPPIFTLRKVQAIGSFKPEEGKQKAPRIVSSRNAPFQAFLKRAKEASGVSLQTKVKLWRVLQPEATTSEVKIKVTNGSMPSPPESREPSPSGTHSTSFPLLIKSEAFKQMPEAVEREMIDMKDETSNDKYNGSVQLGVLGLAADQILILEEERSGKFLSDGLKKPGSSIKKGGLLSSTSSGKNSPKLGPITRGRNRTNGKPQGSVGLTNLGNTCYMNSALQCIRAAEELTCFFLSKAYRKEVNKDNPLGHNGKMALTYASLLDSIYETNSSSVTPGDFKKMLSKCGPQFSGYGQQDSQEFMSFLVDALHEDMNRIQQKPYIENPDSDDRKVHDEGYVTELGNTFRDNYRKRNDSVIHDLFNGFYKNTMVCPTCDKISVTFDPYLLLTLQLPLEHSWQHTVTFIPLRGDPVRVEIDMDKHSTIKQLKEYVAKKVPGLDANRIMMAEIFGKKFYRTVEDKQTIAEANIQSRDDMVLFELDEAPTNFPPPKKKKKSGGYKSFMFSNDDDDDEADIPGDDSPIADVMMVPVFQRAAGNYGSSKSLSNTPFFITINRTESKNYQEIFRKVLAHIAQFSTRDFLHELSLEVASSDGDEERDEDTASAVDTDVQARSVESEDGIVDVSLPDQTTHKPKAWTAESVLDEGVTIPHALLNLFELNVLAKGTEMVPTGFNGIDERKNLKPLSARLPIVSRRPSLDAASSASSDADEVVPSVQPSFNTDGAASEDDDFVMTKKQNIRTYGKNGRARQNGTKSSASDEEKPELDYQAIMEEPILHLGECLFVDWPHNNYDALFEGHGDDDLRGRSKIDKDMPLLEDKELNAKRAKRSERKKTGISLEECFNVTAKGEILTEENAWYCNRCKELRQAEKTLEIWTAPDILVIHLKRFSAARQFRDKIDILVDFPTEGLDLNDKVGLKDDKDLTYDLFAVDNHYGGLGGGHYTAYAKNFVDGEWYEYNDSSVSKRSNASSVVTSAAYLLFYRRRSPQYLGSPDLRKIVSSFRSEDEIADSEGESDSRTTSPSGQGKGHRLGGSFLNGSPSASIGQGAGRLQTRRGGDGSGAGAGALVQIKNGKGTIPGLDGYGGSDNDGEDEGYGGGDEDGVLPDAHFIGPQPPSYHETTSTTFSAYQPWSFAGITENFGKNDNGVGDADADGDVDSTGAMEDDEDDAGIRMVEAFGDDAFGGTMSPHRNNSPTMDPILESTEMESMDFLTQPLMGDGEERMEDLGDPETVELRIESPPAGGAHEKKE